MASLHYAVLSITLLLALSTCLDEVEADCAVKNLNTSICKITFKPTYLYYYQGSKLYANRTDGSGRWVWSSVDLASAIRYSNSDNNVQSLQCGDGTRDVRTDLDCNCADGSLKGTIFTTVCLLDLPLVSMDLSDCIQIDSSLQMYNCH